MESKKRKYQRKQNDPERKQRFCDPGACHCCQYIGDGDFICDEHQTTVVSDWEPTADYMICKKRRVNDGSNYTSVKSKRENIHGDTKYKRNYRKRR